MATSLFVLVSILVLATVIASLNDNAFVFALISDGIYFACSIVALSLDHDPLGNNVVISVGIFFVLIVSRLAAMSYERIADLDKRLSKYAIEIANAYNASVEMHALYVSISSEREGEYLSSINNANKQISMLNTSINTANREIRELESDLADYKRWLSAANLLADERHTQIDDLKVEIKMLKADKRRLHGVIGRMKSNKANKQIALAPCCNKYYAVLDGVMGSGFDTLDECYSFIDWTVANDRVLSRYQYKVVDDAGEVYPVRSDFNGDELMRELFN